MVGILRKVKEVRPIMLIGALVKQRKPHLKLDQDHLKPKRLVTYLLLHREALKLHRRPNLTMYKPSLFQLDRRQLAFLFLVLNLLHQTLIQETTKMVSKKLLKKMWMTGSHLSKRGKCSLRLILALRHIL